MKNEKFKTKKLLLVEDDDKFRDILAQEIAGLNFDIRSAASVEEAKEYLSWEPQIILSDIRLPGKNGMELLPLIENKESTRLVFMTAFGSISQAVDALKAGASDFVTKPIELEVLLEKLNALASEIDLSQSNLFEAGELIDFHGLISVNSKFHRVFEKIKIIAGAHGTVLIQGESGVGKEMIARAIHAESSRKNSPFVPVNCAGLPLELVESELFGHIQGAFTGARADNLGLVQAADRGVLFLDEISEMPWSLQAKLLRFLEEKKARPVGSNQEAPVDVRIIAASNKDLYAEVKAGRFREDLWYRIERFRIEVPSLRERLEDIKPLLIHFLNQSNSKQERVENLVSEEVLNLLHNHTYPGNVRELKNIIEHAALFSKNKLICREHLPDHFLSQNRSKKNVKEDSLNSLVNVERDHINRVLMQVRGNKKKAASILGISRKTLYRKLADE